MKIQILISKSSWANNYKKEILTKLKKFSYEIKILHNHKELKSNNDINIIFSYFKIIPKIYLKKSKINLIPHESNLPKGKGMSSLLSCKSRVKSESGALKFSIDLEVIKLRVNTCRYGLK